MNGSNNGHNIPSSTYPTDYPTWLPEYILKEHREADGSVDPEYIAVMSQWYYDLLYSTPTWTTAQVEDAGFDLDKQNAYEVLWLDEENGTRHYLRFQFDIDDRSSRKVWPIVAEINNLLWTNGGRGGTGKQVVLEWWFRSNGRELAPAHLVGYVHDRVLRQRAMAFLRGINRPNTDEE